MAAVTSQARCSQQAARFCPQHKVLRAASTPTLCSICRASSDTVIPQASFTLPAALLGIAAASYTVDVKPLATVTGILGLFLAIQATRVKFIFGKDDLEVVIGEQTEEQPENAFVGGENKWKFSTFVNWEFWWPGFPVLVYFKETQTKPEGQIHFFPIIFDGKALYETMLARCGSTQNSGPKE